MNELEKLDLLIYKLALKQISKNLLKGVRAIEKGAEAYKILENKFGKKEFDICNLGDDLLILKEGIWEDLIFTIHDFIFQLSVKAQILTEEDIISKNNFSEEQVAYYENIAQQILSIANNTI